MGVRHAREYSEILEELKVAVGSIVDSYLFFEMEAEDWHALSKDEQQEVLEALADDVFYGLGEESQIVVGSATVNYNKQEHRIEIISAEQILNSISLI